MGGDESPHSFVCAAINFLCSHSSVHILLFGDEAILRAIIDSATVSATARRSFFTVGVIPRKLPNAWLDRMTIVHAPDVVDPGDKPSSALRHKPQSSMRLAAEAVASGQADAVLSAGNTGALMAITRYCLGSLPGISRPAICKAMPIAGRSCYVLDLGANLTADAEQLHQFALMGAAIAEGEGLSPAKVGLLNVGIEGQKGSQILHDANETLRADKRFDYVGFVEGHAFFDRTVNVVVCDGFSGNVVLKACEGLARYLISDFRYYFSASWLRRVLAGTFSVVTRGWFKRLNPEAYNGALLLGLNGVAVKSHGGANGAGFLAALQVTYEQAQRKPHIRLSQWLQQ